MSRSSDTEEAARGRLLAAWEPAPGAGDPVGVVASTFTFDAGFFEEELLGRFLGLELSVEDGRAWLVEREQKLGRSGAAVLVDRRHISRSNSLAWDLLGVPMPASTCQHAKVTVLAWEHHIRVMVGSANLSEAAYRRNLEAFACFDFHREGEVPRTVLADLLAFLRRMLDRVPDPADDDVTVTRSPKRRAIALLDAIDALAGKLGLPERWARGTTSAVPVLLEPDRGPGVLEQMRAAWGNRASPDEAWVLSPFWPDPQQGGCEKLAIALEGLMNARGSRALHLFAAGFEDTSSGTWHLDLPAVVVESVRKRGRCEVVLRPVSAQHDGENRPLHAKVLWCGRGRSEEMLLLGSSNASLAGLGVQSAARNYEANLCFVRGDERVISQWFDRCFPAAPRLESAVLVDIVNAQRDEEGGPPPLPAFFRWACFRSSGAGCEIQVGLGRADEPKRWSVSALNGRVALDNREYSKAGSPTTWTCALRLDPAKDVPPNLLEVRWESSGEKHLGHLPINALDEDSRQHAELWNDIDLDTLLELLASGGQLHRSLARIIRRGEGGGAVGPGSEFDPHKRVDTSRLLMQRMRRISRALDGLCERLSATVASDAALEWRFRGPLSPKFFAERLVLGLQEPAERSFLLAEVALAVSRAAGAVRSIGVSDDVVARRFRAAIAELADIAAAHSSTTDGPLGNYVARAFERARA